MFPLKDFPAVDKNIKNTICQHLQPPLLLIAVLDYHSKLFQSLISIPVIFRKILTNFVMLLPLRK